MLYGGVYEKQNVFSAIIIIHSRLYQQILKLLYYFVRHNTKCTKLHLVLLHEVVQYNQLLTRNTKGL